MKKLLLTATAFMLFSFHAWAQDQSPTLDISKMTIPAAPGFVLLDQAPASINKPQNPKALGISLLNLAQGGAVDFCPYWIIPSHPQYTYSKDLNNPFPMLQTFDLSVATSKTDSSSTLSFGFKTQLFRKYRNRDSIMSIVQAIQKELSQADPKKIDVLKVKKLNDSLQKMQPSNVAFNVELAGAYLGQSSTNTFSDLKGTNMGLWLTFDYSCSKSLDILAVTRYRRDISTATTKNTDSSYLDVGASLQYNVGAFSLSAELLYRDDYIYHTSYNRFAFVAEYGLTANINLVASFGKNFQSVNNIIALFGVRFGIGNQGVSL